MNPRAEIKFCQAEKMFGVSRGRLKRLIAQGTLRAVGCGPGRRITMESVIESKLPIQKDLPILEPTKPWWILQKSSDCRWRGAGDICNERSNVIVAFKTENWVSCSKENCPLGVKRPCK